MHVKKIVWKSYSSGYTLLEIMLTLFCSMILLEGLLTYYHHRFSVFQSDNEILNTIESAEKILATLTNQIELAGFIGCAKLTSTFYIPTYASHAITASNKLTSKNSHELSVMYADVIASNVFSITENKIILNAQAFFYVDDMILIADCKQAELAKIKAVEKVKNHDLLILEKNLINIYDKNIQVAKLKHNQFSLKPDGDTYQLTLTDIKHHTKTIANHIHDIEYLFTIRNNDELIDLPANEIANWQDVIGVKTLLTMKVKQQTKKWIAYAYIQK